MRAKHTRTGWVRELEKQFPEKFGIWRGEVECFLQGGLVLGEWLTPQTKDQHPGSSCCPYHPAFFPGSWLCLPFTAVATALGGAGACTLSPAPISPSSPATENARNSCLSDKGPSGTRRNNYHPTPGHCQPLGTATSMEVGSIPPRTSLPFRTSNLLHWSTEGCLLDWNRISTGQGC